MENPAGWTETQKVIDQALYAGDQPGKQVMASLSEKGLLLDRNPDLSTQTESLIDAEYNRYQEMLSTGFCGRSLSGVVYSLLLSFGIIGA